jgi:putative endonuclease
VVEVKTRSGVGFGHPLEAVTPAKLARLRRLAGEWRAAHPGEGGPLRVDVIGVILPRAGGRRIEHVVGAFR